MWKKALLVLILCTVAFGAGAMMFTPQVCASCNTAEFKKMADSGEHKLLDIRTAEEYASGHLAGADQIDFYQTEKFNQYLQSLDKKASYLVYCRSGNRSGKAVEIMKSMGFANVSELSGGINAWTTAGLPLIRQ